MSRVGMDLIKQSNAQAEEVTGVIEPKKAAVAKPAVKKPAAKKKAKKTTKAKR